MFVFCLVSFFFVLWMSSYFFMFYLSERDKTDDGGEVLFRKLRGYFFFKLSGISSLLIVSYIIFSIEDIKKQSILYKIKEILLGVKNVSNFSFSIYLYIILALVILFMSITLINYMRKIFPNLDRNFYGNFFIYIINFGMQIYSIVIYSCIIQLSYKPIDNYFLFFANSFIVIGGYFLMIILKSFEINVSGSLTYK